MVRHVVFDLTIARGYLQDTWGHEPRQISVRWKPVMAEWMSRAVSCIPFIGGGQGTNSVVGTSSYLDELAIEASLPSFKAAGRCEMEAGEV